MQRSVVVGTERTRLNRRFVRARVARALAEVELVAELVLTTFGVGLASTARRFVVRTTVVEELATSVAEARAIFGLGTALAVALTRQCALSIRTRRTLPINAVVSRRTRLARADAQVVGVAVLVLLTFVVVLAV